MNNSFVGWNKIGILDCGFGWKQGWHNGLMTGSHNIIIEERDHITESYNYDTTIAFFFKN